MSFREETPFSKDFYRQLAELRLKVDSAPEAHRPALCQFAAQIERQHREMQEGCAHLRDLDADIGLSVESTKFHLWACGQDSRPRGRGRESTGAA